ncbi:MRPL23 family protein [Megaselia abdita]
MSTRWYPIYQRGGPQLRVFLPNFWMKVIRPTEIQPENVVTFSCSMEMSKPDIKNYLEKIYNIPVVDVRTRIATGPTKKDQIYGYVTKADDIKIAYVTLPKENKFVFPDLFPQSAKDKKEQDEKSLEESKVNFKKYLDRNKGRPGAPGWFSI